MHVGVRSWSRGVQQQQLDADSKHLIESSTMQSSDWQEMRGLRPSKVHTGLRECLKSANPIGNIKVKLQHSTCSISIKDLYSDVTFFHLKIFLIIWTYVLEFFR